MHSRDKSSLEELRCQSSSLAVHENTSPQFERLRLYYNRGLTECPLAIVRPSNEGEVSQVVSFCLTKHMPFSIRSGGHDFFGRSLIPDGIVIDMRAMDSIDVAPDRASATVGGGVIAGALQQTLASQGLFTPTGQAKTVGYVAWACGGGYGFYVGTYGFGVDQILGARVVVADGRVVDTDEDENLLWALRGAGIGTFGIVVELRIKVYPAPKLYAGFLAFPLDEASKVLQRLGEVLPGESLPDEFSGDAIVAKPGMLQLAVSEPCFVFYWCWTAIDGNLEPARAFLEKTKAFGTVLVNTVGETTATAFGGGDSSSVTFFRHCTVKDLNAEIGATLARNSPPQPLSAVVVHNNHGKGVRGEGIDGISACFPHRHRHVILGIHGGTQCGSVPAESAVAEATCWVNTLLREVSETGKVLDGGFPSFSPPDEVDPLEFFGPAATERLLMVKRRLDPDNLFNKALPRLH